MSKKDKETTKKVKADEVETEVISPELVKAEEKIKDLEKDLEQTKDNLMRTAAEYDNYRKRTTKEKEMTWGDAQAATISSILPVADNIERALASAEGSDLESLKKGIEMVQTQLKEIFEKLGVEEIEGKGEEFNPDFQSAVAHIESEELGENIVSEVFLKGYKNGDRIIRYAMVQVAN